MLCVDDDHDGTTDERTYSRRRQDAVGREMRLANWQDV